MSAPAPYVPAGDRCGGCGRAQSRLDTDGNGRLVEIATPCRCAYWRRINRICRWCDSPVTGKPKVAVYCDRHRIKAARLREERYRAANPDVPKEAARRYRERYPERARESARRSYQNNPEIREARNQYKREWRQKNRDLVKLQKRRKAIRDPEKLNAWQRQYREDVAAGIRKPKSAPRNARGERLCLTPECGAVMRGRAKKCDACRRGYLPQPTRKAA